MGADLPIWSALPFIAILVAITLLELAAGGWWAKLTNKAIVSAVVAIVAVLLLVGHGSSARHALGETLIDYLSFIAMLAALYVIAGGVQVRGRLRDTPAANVALLAVGALLANLIGTTGAAMVMVRPFLRANAARQRHTHLIVFFILIVANGGGLLTPLGDPPLYLGFLRGVPFTWTLRLWPIWLLVNGLLLAVFWLVDRRAQRREPTAPASAPGDPEPFGVSGLGNVGFLAATVLVILASGAGWLHGGQRWPAWVSVVLLLALAVGSYVTTPRRVHTANHFSLGPIASVAIVFFGIFVAMTAPLLMLDAHADDLGLDRDWHFFWASGALSSVLDNAPTYLSFASVAAGEQGVPVAGQYLGHLVGTGPGAAALAAISAGSVLMGALTYVGNGPNLMVREVAEHRGIRTPGFLAYIGMAAAVFLPILVLVTVIFFRG